ncbi:MAG: hypothetical protein Q9168_002099 [Polycauliona sp. 1 TL-2023]
MYIPRPLCLIAVLLVQSEIFTAAFEVPAAPVAAAGEGSAAAGANVGSAGRVGDDVTPDGNAQSPTHIGAGDDSPAVGVGHDSVPNGDPAIMGGSSDENPGEVFEKVLDIVEQSLPDQNNNPNSLIITPAPIATSAVTNLNARACLQANDIHNRCTAQTPNFDFIASSSQASCLCYGTAFGTMNWQPQSYGGLMSSCYQYIRVQPAQATATGAALGVSEQADLCGQYGDVRKSAGDATATANANANTVQPETTGGAIRLVGGKVLLLSVGLLGTIAVS